MFSLPWKKDRPLAQPVKQKIRRPCTIPLLTDRPMDSPGLGFESTVRTGTNIILENANDERGFTIGVFGPWGSGKSSILREMRRRLDNEPGFLTVAFEAWRFGDSKLLMVELIRALTARLSEEGIIKKNPFRKVLDYGTTMAAGVATPPLGFAGSSLGISDAVNDLLVSAWNDSKIEEGSSASDLFDVFRGLADKLSENDTHAVLLIDDLDRCSPDGIAQILSTLNALMDLDRFIFVLALDRAYIVSAITDAFGLKDEDGNRSVAFGDRFLEKIIQVPLAVPQIEFDEKTLEEFLGKDVLKVLEAFYGFTKDNQSIVQEEIIPNALRSNPRQVKRFFNSYIISYSVNLLKKPGNHREIVRAMLYLIALNTAAPPLYQRLSDDIAKSRRADGDGALRTIGETETIKNALDAEGGDRGIWIDQLYQQNPMLELFISNLSGEYLPR